MWCLCYYWTRFRMYCSLNSRPYNVVEWLVVVRWIMLYCTWTFYRYGWKEARKVYGCFNWSFDYVVWNPYYCIYQKLALNSWIDRNCVHCWCCPFCSRFCYPILLYKIIISRTWPCCRILCWVACFWNYSVYFRYLRNVVFLLHRCLYDGARRIRWSYGRWMASSCQHIFYWSLLSHAWICFLFWWLSLRVLNLLLN